MQSLTKTLRFDLKIKLVKDLVNIYYDLSNV
jgi:hypothetical protein